MKSVTSTVELTPPDRYAFVDLTEHLERAIKDSGVTDGAAVAFPLVGEPPFFAMGEPGAPVNVWMWKAERQVDVASAFQDLETVYPNLGIDSYPDPDRSPLEQPLRRALTLASSPTFVTAWGAGNIVADPTRRSAVEDLRAEGFGTLRARPGADQAVATHGVWAHDTYRVVLRRALPGVGVDAVTFRQKCREYASQQIDLQRTDFKRLGVLGDWDNPYRTMDAKFEADMVRALATIYANGHVTRGFKPVHWCFDCGSALAEAEIEYADKTSPAIDVAYDVIDKTAVLAAFGVATDIDAIVAVPIWTTTPWTLPASIAVTLGFPPEDFHIRIFQTHGVVSGVRGTTVLLNRVSAADVHRIARYYWVRRISPQ